MPPTLANPAEPKGPPPALRVPPPGLRTPLGGEAASGASLDVPACTFFARRITAILGANGSGKTTLLRTLAGLVRPTQGTVELASLSGMQASSVHALPAQDRAKAIAFISQRSEASEAFSSQEIVALGLHAQGVGTQHALERARHGLAQVDALHLATQPFATLSGGERQRVSLARALVQLGLERDASASPAQQMPDPRVLLADEPTSAMDVRHALRSLGVLRRAASWGAAVVLAMHDVAQALRTCDDCLLLTRPDQGNARVLFAGPVADLPDAALDEAFGVRFSPTTVASGAQAGSTLRGGFAHEQVLSDQTPGEPGPT